MTLKTYSNSPQLVKTKLNSYSIFHRLGQATTKLSGYKISRQIGPITIKLIGYASSLQKGRVTTNPKDQANSFPRKKPRKKNIDDTSSVLKEAYKQTHNKVIQNLNEAYHDRRVITNLLQARRQSWEYSYQYNEKASKNNK